MTFLQLPRDYSGLAEHIKLQIDVIIASVRRLVSVSGLLNEATACNDTTSNRIDTFTQSPSEWSSIGVLRLHQGQAARNAPIRTTRKMMHQITNIEIFWFLVVIDSEL